MKFIPYKSAPESLCNGANTVYLNSFPRHEIRSIETHKRALNDEKFKAMIVCDDRQEQLIGIFYYWMDEGLIYGEHLAIDPAIRGNNMGSQIISTFLEENQDKLFILEIDPPIDEISIRRRNFYERLGLVMNPYHYTHPSYMQNGYIHQLNLMSYPRQITSAELETFKTFMQERVLKYIDQE